MSMSDRVSRSGRRLLGAGLLLCGLCESGRAEEIGPGPMLGQPVDEPEIASWVFTVDRYGKGLPPGSGTVAQGEALYQAKCEKCHGPAGRGASAEELTGGIGSLGSAYPDKTVGSYWPYAPPLFDYIRRAMPIDAPFSLSDDQVYALVAYLLYLNRFIDRDQVVDASTLPQVRLPNRNGFVPADETSMRR